MYVIHFMSSNKLRERFSANLCIYRVICSINLCINKPNFSLVLRNINFQWIVYVLFCFLHSTISNCFFFLNKDKKLIQPNLGMISMKKKPSTFNVIISVNVIILFQFAYLKDAVDFCAPRNKPQSIFLLY